MTRTLQSFGLLLLLCVLSTTGDTTAQQSPPKDMGLTWADGMFPEICWPEDPARNCKYEIRVNSMCPPRTHRLHISSKPYCMDKKTIMCGGFVKFVVSSPCMNESAVIINNDAVLVTSWKCVIHSSSSTHCSWQPAPDAPPDLSFFYMLACENVCPFVVSSLKECPSYTYTGKIRSGCNLTMKPNESIHVLFNGTGIHKTVRNTYRDSLVRVKPPPVKFNITKTAKKLDIRWIPPDVSLNWRFHINYTRCDQPQPPKSSQGTNSTLDREPSCQYRIKIKATSIRGETDWSEEQTIDAEFNVSLFAAINIPLVLALVVVLTLVCCHKNKENIFPKVPVPRDLLSDISENNNKITVGKLYSPAKEEEDCKITLVIDPLINKVDT